MRRRLEPLARLTRRPLPEPGVEVAALGEHARARLGSIWLGRARNELQVSQSFAYLAGALRDLGADPALVGLATRAITDEQRHAEIAWLVACAFAGVSLPEPERTPLELPAHPGAGAELERVLHIVGASCVNETLGSAFLETCLAGAEDPLARAALRELLADEIDHARIGWSLLAGYARTDERRARVTPWVTRLLAGTLDGWVATAQRSVGAGLRCYGCPPTDDVAATLFGAVRDLVIPGFAMLGIGVEDAQVWLSGHPGAPPLVPGPDADS